MEYTLLERLKLWLCRTFGHREREISGSGEVVCIRCHQLISTPYSRQKDGDM